MADQAPIDSEAEPVDEAELREIRIDLYEDEIAALQARIAQLEEQLRLARSSPDHMHQITNSSRIAAAGIIDGMLVVGFARPGQEPHYNVFPTFKVWCCAMAQAESPGTYFGANIADTPFRRLD